MSKVVTTLGKIKIITIIIITIIIIIIIIGKISSKEIIKERM